MPVSREWIFHGILLIIRIAKKINATPDAIWASANNDLSYGVSKTYRQFFPTLLHWLLLEYYSLSY